MNTGRFVGAALGIWMVRVALNGTFYTRVVGRQMEQINAAHPDMFRTVIPAYNCDRPAFCGCFCVIVRQGWCRAGRRTEGWYGAWGLRGNPLSSCWEFIRILLGEVSPGRSDGRSIDLPSDCPRGRGWSRWADLQNIG